MKNNTKKNTNTNTLTLQIKRRKQLLHIAKNNPLALSKLWVPYCHRWDGLGEKSKRPKGCKKPMEYVKPGIYHCSTCNITEKRTSQREALTRLGTASLIVGGNRSGKTQCGAMLAVATALGRNHWSVRQWLDNNQLPDTTVPNKEPCNVIASSLSYGDALTYVRPKLDMFLPAGCKKIRWSSQDRGLCILPNGGKIYSLSADSGRKRYQGLGNVGLGWLDEEHSDESIFSEIQMRCVDNKYGHVILTLTPLMGLTWTYEKFIAADADKTGFVYHKLSGLDNPYVSSTKFMKTIAHMSEESKRSRLYGDFTNQSGLVYAEFDRNLHVVEPEQGNRYKFPDFNIQNRDRWQIIVSIDFGVRNPFAALLIAFNPKSDTFLIVDEYYRTEQTTIQNGHALKAKFKPLAPFDFVVADPEAKDARMILARQCGLHNKPAPKHIGVVQTINMVKHKLCLDEENKPHLFVSSRCKELLKEFRQYKWSSNNTGKDKPVKKFDHGLDALRYAVAFITRRAMHL